MWLGWPICAHAKFGTGFHRCPRPGQEFCAEISLRSRHDTYAIRSTSSSHPEGRIYPRTRDSRLFDELGSLVTVVKNCEAIIQHGHRICRFGRCCTSRVEPKCKFQPRGRYWQDKKACRLTEACRIRCCITATVDFLRR